ncbi:MAG: hypothetical protein EU535_01535 [Promethearchaeota archaeon]|nr:MAG: hypothetical protein EU535_01535 [Candidatus Lokiarchaeota archaeon]
MNKKVLFRISSILALIFSVTGAILMLVTPWSYWWTSGSGGGIRWWVSGTVGVWTAGVGPFLILAAIFLLICALISLLAVLPGKITNRTPLIISLIFSIVVLVMIVIGAVLTAVIMAADELYWEFGAGFYGGISGTLLTILFTLLMIVTWEK